MEETTEKPTTVKQRPAPFIFRLTHGFLKRFSLILAIICFVLCALNIGLIVYSLSVALIRNQALDAKFFAEQVVSVAIIGLFGKWFLTRSEYFKRA